MGFYRDNGKENGNYYNIGSRVEGYNGIRFALGAPKEKEEWKRKWKQGLGFKV